MILPITKFKVKLIAMPRYKDKDGKFKEIETVKVGKKYRVYSIYDNGQGFTDFLIADDEGIFRWVNISVFRGK